MADSSAAPAVPPPTRKYVLKERKISFGRDKPKKDAEEEAPAAASPHMPDEVRLDEGEITTELAALRKQRESADAPKGLPDAPQVPPPRGSYVMKKRTLSFERDKKQGVEQQQQQLSPQQTLTPQKATSPQPAISPAGLGGLARARTAKATDFALGAADPASPMPTAAPLPPAPTAPPPPTALPPPPTTTLAPLLARPRSSLFVSHVDWPAQRRPFVSYASATPPPQAADAAGPVMGAGVLGEDEDELKADAMLNDSEDEKDEDGPLAPAMAAAATAEEADAPLLGSARASQRGLESFRGTVKKAETITPNGVIGRVVPADHRRKIILDVSADGITVHDLGEKAQERARTQTGTIRGMIVPMDFIAAWDPKVAERRIIIILSKDMSKFKRLVLHDIDAEGVAAALQQCAMMRAEVLAEEIAQLRQDQEDRAVRRSSSRSSTSRFSLSRARSILGGSSMLSSLDRATSKSEAFEGIDDITRAEAEAELGV